MVEMLWLFQKLALKCVTSYCQSCPAMVWSVWVRWPSSVAVDQRSLTQCGWTTSWWRSSLCSLNVSCTRPWSVWQTTGGSWDAWEHRCDINWRLTYARHNCFAFVVSHAMAHWATIFHSVVFCKCVSAHVTLLWLVCHRRNRSVISACTRHVVL